MINDADFNSNLRAATLTATKSNPSKIGGFIHSKMGGEAGKSLLHPENDDDHLGRSDSFSHHNDHTVTTRLLSTDSQSSQISLKELIKNKLLQAFDDDPNESDEGDEFTTESHAEKEQNRLKRRKLFIRSIYAEFICTTIFMSGIFGTVANCYQQGASSSTTQLSGALVSGLGVVSMTFAFSDMSGAQMNCAISFALWFTKRLSNRKLACYVIAQLLASLVAAGLIYCTFPGADKALFYAIQVKPPASIMDESGVVAEGVDMMRLFLTELLCTFILSYVAFTVAFEDAQRARKEMAELEQHLRKSQQELTQNEKMQRGLALYTTNPQSKSGFAPFAIGLIVFVLALYGGSSGVSMNPVRLFGPAVFSGDWDYLYLYVIAEFIGAAAAAVTVHNFHNYGVDN